MVQDQFSIYQVKAGREYRPYRFHAYTYMLQHDLAITGDHYDLVYTSTLYPGDDPDIIRNRINEKRPKRFHGHSVSMEGAGSGGDERIITLRTTNYLLKGRKGLWLAEDMILVDGRPFFLLQHQDFGNDAAFAVVDEYGNQAAYDSYDGFTDDVIRQIRQFLQKEKEQKTQLEAGLNRYTRTYDMFSAIPVQRVEETIHSSNLQLGNSAHLLENWQKSYQNGEYIRSAESGEEANYNMVDGLHNNQKKRKQGKKPRSVLKRLHEKQMEVARREGKFPHQQLPQVMQKQEIERKPKK